MTEHDADIDRDPWSNAHIAWKNQATWVPLLTEWLRPYLRKRAFERLKRKPRQHLYVDDPAWLHRLTPVIEEKIEEIIDFLADDLSNSILQTYHGCRVIDASSFYREGLKINNPSILEKEARKIVLEEEGFSQLRSIIDQKIKNFTNRERDTGKLYIIVDDRELINNCSHYLLYGSEWIQCLLGPAAQSTLIQRGSPTIIKINLPLRYTYSGDRKELATVLLREWSRQQTSGDDRPPILDFTFTLKHNIPAEYVVGHTHPRRIRDPSNYMIIHSNSFTDCPSCRKHGR